MPNLIVLAGGEGRRMGCVDKCTQQFGGKPLFQYVVESAKAFVDQSILIGDFYNVAIEGYPRFKDIEPAQGPMSGLYSLSRQNISGTLLISACDMPNLCPEVWHTLLAQYDGRQPVFGSTLESPFLLLIVCDATDLESLARQFEAGERRIRKWLETINARGISLEKWSSALENMNTFTRP